MKFKAGDTVVVTGGKDKGKQGVVARVFPKENTVIVENVNLYVRHIKPMGGRSGEKMSLPRPLPTAKVAIINDQGKADRIAYTVAKDGQKTRIFKKTGKVVPEPKQATDKKTK